MLKPELDLNALVERNNNTTPIMPLLTPQAAKPKKIFSLAELDGCRISHETSFPPPEAILKVGGSDFAVRGEVSIITGLPKAGKSTILQMCVAAPFLTGRNVDLLTIYATPIGKQNIVYIDTEQSKGSTQKFHNHVLRLIDTKCCPKNLRIWNWLKYSVDDRVEALKAMFDQLPDLQLIIIDGIADLLNSVNDELKANELLEWLTNRAGETNCAVVVVIHENFGNGQARGHIGSGLGRKCAGTISVKKDRAKNISWLQCTMLRHSAEFENVYFQWEPELKRMVLVDKAVADMLNREAKKTDEEKADERRERLAQVLKQSFANSAIMDKKELKARICLYYDPDKPTSDKTADRVLKEATDEYGLLACENKVYTLIKDTPF